MAAISTFEVPIRKPRRILAQAAALHDERHHVHRRSRRAPGRPPPPAERSVWPPPDAPATAIRPAIHLRQRLHEIQRANRVPQLQAQRREAPELIFGLVKRCSVWQRIVVAHHVVGECHVSLARQADSQRRAGIASPSSPGGRRSSGRAASAPRAPCPWDAAAGKDSRPGNSRAWSRARLFRWSTRRARCGRRFQDVEASFREAGTSPPPTGFASAGAPCAPPIPARWRSAAW